MATGESAPPQQVTSVPSWTPTPTILPVPPVGATPTGAGDASAANQVIEATSLAAINAKLTRGQTDNANSLAVVLSSNQTAIPVTGTLTGPVTVADGADVTVGAIGDAGVTTDVTGTISAKLRGLVKMLASVVSGGYVMTNGSGVTQPVSGTLTVNNTVPSSLKVDLSGTSANSQAIKVDNSAVTQPVSIGDGSAITTGAKADSVATTDTGTFTLVALIKRGLQTLTSILGGVQTKQPTVTYVSSSAYEAGHLITASAGKVIRNIVGFNSKNAQQFIQLFDSASLPVDTSVPVMVWSVLAQDNFNLPCAGLKCANGWYVTNSTTGPTKTIGATDCFFTAQIET